MGGQGSTHLGEARPGAGTLVPMNPGGTRVSVGPRESQKVCRAPKDRGATLAEAVGPEHVLQHVCRWSPGRRG